MIVIRGVLFIGLFIACGAPALDAQVLRPVSVAAPQPKKAGSTRKAALIALEPLIEEIRLLDDLEQRVALAEPLVTLLAATRPDTCRKLLASLLDDSLRLKNETSRASNAPEPDSLARRIIKAAAAFDQKFAKSLFDKYAADNDPRKDSSPDIDRSRTKNHLLIATQLIDADIKLSAAIAQAVIAGPVLPESLVFLNLLRQKDSATANRLFGMALAGTRARGGSDTNESLLLYSYVFSPRQIPIVTTQGLGVYHLADLRVTMPHPPNAAVAEQYLNVTAQLLLDPARYGRPDLQPVFGPMGDWFLIKFVEPLTATYRPQLVESLAAQRYVLESQMAAQRTEATASFDRWSNSSRRNSESQSESIESLLERAEKAPNTKRRDQFRYRAAMAALKSEDYERAIKIADEISLEYRDEAKQYLGFAAAMTAITQGKMDYAARVAEKDNDLARRAYLFTLIAGALTDLNKPDLDQARLYLSAVEEIVPKLKTDNERVSALAAITQIYGRFDRAKAFTCLHALITYANKIESFTADVTVSRMLDIGGFYFDYSLYRDTSIDETLRNLAALDFQATLEAARRLENRFARIKTTIAVCKSVLSTAPMASNNP